MCLYLRVLLVYNKRGTLLQVKPRQKITSKQAEMVALGVGAIQRELKLSQLNHPCADLSLMVESKSTTKQDHSNH